MKHPVSPEHIWIIDAFTTTPFMGNAAAVCLMDAFPAQDVMQITALCMQLSETAFVIPDGSKKFKIRWFTTQIEVNLCGHATLAATHVLRQSGAIKTGDTITFDSMSGTLTCTINEDNSVSLDFPTLSSERAKAPSAMNALNVPITNCELSRDNYIVEVKDYITLQACTPNFKKLSKLDAQGVIVTTAKGIPEISGKKIDFASRYFCPILGIDEDPVTGSAHCTLAPYWSQRLNKTEFNAYQASKGRGELHVTLNENRTKITGHCVTTFRASQPREETPRRRRNKEKTA